MSTFVNTLNYPKVSQLVLEIILKINYVAINLPKMIFHFDLDFDEGFVYLYVTMTFRIINKLPVEHSFNRFKLKLIDN